MPRFHLRFHECDGSIADVGDAVDAENVDEARAAAIVRARAVMAEEVKNGRLCLSCWIVISDDHGNNVHTLQFGDAIEFKESPACGHATRADALKLG